MKTTYFLEKTRTWTADGRYTVVRGQGRALILIRLGEEYLDVHWKRGDRTFRVRKQPITRQQMKAFLQAAF